VRAVTETTSEERSGRVGLYGSGLSRDLFVISSSVGGCRA
jgi:hypothetical protein